MKCPPLFIIFDIPHNISYITFKPHFLLEYPLFELPLLMILSVKTEAHIRLFSRSFPRRAQKERERIAPLPRKKA